MHLDIVPRPRCLVGFFACFMHFHNRTRSGAEAPIENPAVSLRLPCSTFTHPRCSRFNQHEPGVHVRYWNLESCWHGSLLCSPGRLIAKCRETLCGVFGTYCGHNRHWDSTIQFTGLSIGTQWTSELWSLFNPMADFDIGFNVGYLFGAFTTRCLLMADDGT